MHVEKNVCDNIIRKLLNVKRKKKDGVKVQKDLADMGICYELHAQSIEDTPICPHVSPTF